MNRPSFSIGIEEEYQTIDPETRDLRSHIQSEILTKAKLATMDRAKPELHQAVVEVGTKVCRDIDEAREDILDLRRQMITLASESGMLLAAASTHPFAHWTDWWRAPISSSGYTCTSASRIATPRSTS
jgi:glutamate---cysteine ligase / carboxylate-amine ligase